MSLLAVRCVFRPMFSRNLRNVVSKNVITFTILRYHKVNLKRLLPTSLTFVSKRATQNADSISKRYINITATLKMSKNYYDILGIPRNSSQKQIKDAYYRLAMKHHPDKNQGTLTQRFREIKEAYDVLSNDSSRMKYDSGSSNNDKSTSSNWSSNSSYGRYKSDEEYKWKNRSEYRRPPKYERYAYSYDHLKPFNVFINVIKVPKNVVKTQVDMMLFTFVKNRTLKLILFYLFQFLWKRVLKNVDYNILISTNSSSNPFEEFIKNILQNNTVRIQLTEMEALKGKAVRIHVNDNEKVLVVNIPRGVKKDQSFYLFYLLNDDDDDSNSHKI